MSSPFFAGVTRGRGQTRDASPSRPARVGPGVPAWTLIVGFTSWYNDPVMLNAFWLVVVFQVPVLVWAFRRSARGVKRYWDRVGEGTLISVVAGVIVIGSSFLFTTVAFPE